MPRRGRLWKDHPRVCGEHPAAADASAGTGGGSSPRMRGARTAIFGRPTSGRIIPAYAGSTRTADTVMCLWGDHSAYAGSTVVLGSEGWQGRDHPRVCGEHLFTSSILFVLEGSSPRMRGAHFGLAGQPWVSWIIPAYAGSTWTRAWAWSRSGDHPRVCGEHVSAL